MSSGHARFGCVVGAAIAVESRPGICHLLSRRCPSPRCKQHGDRPAASLSAPSRASISFRRPRTISSECLYLLMHTTRREPLLSGGRVRMRTRGPCLEHEKCADGVAGSRPAASPRGLRHRLPVVWHHRASSARHYLRGGGERPSRHFGERGLPVPRGAWRAIWRSARLPYGVTPRRCRLFARPKLTTRIGGRRLASVARPWPSRMALAFRNEIFGRRRAIRFRFQVGACGAGERRRRGRRRHTLDGDVAARRAAGRTWICDWLGAWHRRPQPG